MERALPAGTVTFLFTDVEGSTRLLHSLGEERYADALAEHRRILRAAFGARGGVEVDTQGDAFFIAFPTAPAALAAAAAATEELAPGPIRVRMGLHSGTPLLTDEGYVGVDVHRAARIAACGHGGQILLSTAAAGLVDAGRPARPRRAPPQGPLRARADLPVRQRRVPAAQEPLPHQPARPRDAVPRPRPTSSTRSPTLLRASEPRLLTLTGPGGVGKTRLALQAAGAAADSFADGVFWVPLAPLDDPQLVLPTVAQALGAEQDVAGHIADRSLLLVLDNFEHLTDAADDVAALLTACPRLHAARDEPRGAAPPRRAGLSRHRAAPRGRRRALPLARARRRPVVRLDATASPRSARGSSSCRSRSSSPPHACACSRPRSCSTASRAGSTCSRRAAASTRASRRCARRSSGATSCSTPTSSRLFARLAVFAGGWTLLAAEAVTDADLDVAQSLVDKSLVRARERDRFFMLETIREFAAEQLDALRRRRRRAPASRRPLPRLRGGRGTRARGRPPGRVVRAGRGRPAEPPRRARLEPRARARRRAPDRGRAQAFWFARGYLSEGRRWLAAGLAAYDERTPIRARALSAASLLASMQGDWPETKRCAEESRAARRASSATPGSRASRC